MGAKAAVLQCSKFKSFTPVFPHLIERSARAAIEHGLRVTGYIGVTRRTVVMGQVSFRVPDLKYDLSGVRICEEGPVGTQKLVDVEVVTEPITVPEFLSVSNQIGRCAECLDVSDALEKVRKERRVHPLDGGDHDIVKTSRATQPAPFEPTLETPHANDEVVGLDML